MNLHGLMAVLRDIAATRRPRDERGEGVLQVLIGAFAITLIVGGFIGFYFSSDEAARENSDRTSAESAGLQALNRIGRDIEESSRVIESAENELVVEQPASGTQVRRIYYGLITGSDGLNLVTKREVVDSSTPYSATANWQDDADTTAIGRALTVESKFEYFSRTGNTVATPAEVGRVDTTYVARAARGNIRLKTSSAVKVAAGGGGGSAVGTVEAESDTATLTLSGTGTGSVVIPLGANDTCGSAACPTTGAASWNADTPSPSTGASVTPDPSTTGSVTLTIGSTFPRAAAGSSRTLSFSYTLTHAGRSSTAVVTVTVTSAAALSASGTAPTVAADPCGTASDTYTINAGSPAAGVTYTVGGVTRAPGTYSTGGLSSVTVTAAANPGYTYTGTSSWTLNFTNASCGTTATASAPTVAVDQCGTASDTYTINAGSPAAGVTYTVGGVTRAPGTYSTGGLLSVSVTAAANPGYTLSGTSSWTLAFTNASCGGPSTATATAPTAFDDCATATDTYTINAGTPSDGVVYTVAGSTRAPGTYDTAGAGTVTVTAAAAPGYTLSGTSSWTLSYPDTAPCVASATSLVAFPSAAPATFAATTGTNTVRWTGGTAPFSVQVNTSGTWVTLSANATSPYNHTGVPLGTSYAYRVVASDGTSNSDASVQFPPNPATATAVGSDRNNDRVPEALGSSLVSWSAVAGAAHYVVTELDSTDGVNTTATSDVSPNVTSTSWTDSNENTRASQALYRVAAYAVCDPQIQNSGTALGGTPPAPTSGSGSSARCASPAHYSLPSYSALSGAGLIAYQAPDTVSTTTPAFGSGANASSCSDVSTVANTADNRFYACSSATGAATWSFTTDPDAGDAAFCGFTGANCFALRAKTNNGAAPSQATTFASGTTVTWGPQSRTENSSGAGAADGYSLTSCNRGGCANIITTTVYAHPGDVTLSGLTQTEGLRHRTHTAYYANGCGSGCSGTNTPEVRIIYSAGLGSDVTNWRFWSSGGDTANNDTKNQPSNAETGGVAAAPASSSDISVLDATVYTAEYRAQANDGVVRWRSESRTLFTSPPPLTVAQDAMFCRATIDDGYKYAISYQRRAIKGDGTNSAFTSGARVFAWVGKFSATSGPSTYLNVVTAKFSAASNDTTVTWPSNNDPAAWDNITSSNVNSSPDQAWYNITDAGAMTNANSRYMIGGTADGRRLPYSTNTNRPGGAARFESYTTTTLAGSPNWGDTSRTFSLAGTGFGSIDFQFGSGGTNNPATCPALSPQDEYNTTDTQWRVVDGNTAQTMSRYGDARISGYANTPYGSGRTGWRGGSF